MAWQIVPLTRSGREVMIRTTILILVTVSLFFCDVASAQVSPQHERFFLWNECRPIRLFVRHLVWNGTLEDTASKYNDVTMLIRSRLRAARMYEPDKSKSTPYLGMVLVHYKNTAYVLELEFAKWLYDPISDVTFAATTWSELDGGATTNWESIRSTVSRSTDKFIDEYLRVNADACTRLKSCTQFRSRVECW